MLVAFSQTVEDISENARANLEYIDMRFGAPVYVGRHHRGGDQGAERAYRRRAARTWASCTCSRRHERTSASDDEAVVMTWQRKVQVYKRDDWTPSCTRRGRAGCHRLRALAAGLRPEPRTTSHIAHLSSPDSYFEDFEVGTRIEHSRGRTMTERAHPPDGGARQHEPGALQPVHDRSQDPEQLHRRAS